MAVLSLCNPFPRSSRHCVALMLRTRVASRNASCHSHGTMYPWLFSTWISSHPRHGSLSALHLSFSWFFPHFQLGVSLILFLCHDSRSASPRYRGSWAMSHHTLPGAHQLATMHNGFGTERTFGLITFGLQRLLSVSLPQLWSLSVLSFPSQRLWTVQAKLSQTSTLLQSFRCGPSAPGLDENGLLDFCETVHLCTQRITTHHTSMKDPKTPLSSRTCAGACTRTQSSMFKVSASSCMSGGCSHE